LLERLPTHQALPKIEEVAVGALAIFDVAGVVIVAVASQPSCFGQLLLAETVVERAVDVAEDALHRLHVFFSRCRRKSPAGWRNAPA
jgi:hypothetical protein